MDRRADEEFATPKEFARMAGVSTRTIRRWIESNYCPKPVQIGGNPKWRFGVIRRWLWEIEAEQSGALADKTGHLRTSPETTENLASGKKNQ